MSKNHPHENHEPDEYPSIKEILKNIRIIARDKVEDVYEKHKDVPANIYGSLKKRINERLKEHQARSSERPDNSRSHHDEDQQADEQNQDSEANFDDQANDQEDQPDQNRTTKKQKTSLKELAMKSLRETTARFKNLFSNESETPNVQKTWIGRKKTWLNELAMKGFRKTTARFKNLFGNESEISDIRREHILRDDDEYPSIPRSRFEQVKEAKRFGGGETKVWRLQDYFGRTNRDPFKRSGDWTNPDMKEIKKVVDSIDPAQKNILTDTLEKFKREVDPAFGHAKVKPLELISDIEMLNGKICTLGVVSSKDLASDVAARLKTNRTKLSIAEDTSNFFIGIFNKNWKRKTLSTIGITGISLFTSPAVLLTIFIPKVQREILKHLKGKHGQEPPAMNSEKIEGILNNPDLSSLRAFSIGKGHQIDLERLPRKMRWLELNQGWCFLPSIKKQYPNQTLIYKDKTIIEAESGKSISPKFIVKSPATWEIFFQQIGKKSDCDLPLNGKVFTENIKATRKDLFLPPDIRTVQNLDLTGVTQFYSASLRTIEGDVNITSNEAFRDFPDGVIYRGKFPNKDNLDQQLVDQKLRFVAAKPKQS